MSIRKGEQRILLYQINIISILKFREFRVPPELIFRDKKLRNHYINRKRYSGIMRIAVRDVNMSQSE
jgi:hypothetical protein